MPVPIRSRSAPAQRCGALLAAALAAALGGCVSFGAKPPASLMTLDATASPAVGSGGAITPGSTVTVAIPAFPQELATARVPVHTGSSVTYVKDAAWIDVPARLFRNLLAETITARTGRATLDARDYHLAPGTRLGGRLQAFGLDATAMAAVVTYDAMLENDGKPLQKRRFEARASVGSVSPASARMALNQAANQVAAEVADWVGR